MKSQSIISRLYHCPAPLLQLPFLVSVNVTLKILVYDRSYKSRRRAPFICLRSPFCEFFEKKQDQSQSQQPSIPHKLESGGEGQRASHTHVPSKEWARRNVRIQNIPMGNYQTPMSSIGSHLNVVSGVEYIQSYPCKNRVSSQLTHTDTNRICSDWPGFTIHTQEKILKSSTKP